MGAFAEKEGEGGAPSLGQIHEPRCLESARSFVLILTCELYDRNSG